ncbi:uncharacterized protein LOC127117986 [Lathyrus oleraceus]|uniref:MD-2-related lipid-recognition domain-containing protein n=1 Tax=Pisum sativum TaxID=3888 RepID=A0A9D4Y7C8_PEA|nr:uncharacterized protein LOC127117986 [Pisum sativum]KAI5433662.1 hypothetical protein KIW84_020799 [Pisum sativum]
MAVHSTSKLNLILCLSSTLLLLSSSHAQAESQNLEYCQKDVGYAVKISSVEILPDPVVRGQPFTFKIEAYTDAPIHSGDLIYEISYAGIEGKPAIFHHALSEETLLPVRPGSFLLTHTELLPPVTPPGTYNVKLTFDDNDGDQLTCIIFPFTIGAKSSVSAI